MTLSGSGPRTRKKHKRLDAINEEVFVEKHHKVVKGEGNEELLGNDSELRRSSRARRRPVVLDVSPSPSRKRNRKEMVGREKGSGGSFERGRTKARGERRRRGSLVPEAKVEEEEEEEKEEEEEEAGGGGSRLVSRDESERESLKKINVYQRRGKRKLFADFDDGGEEIKPVKVEVEDEVVCLDDEMSRVIKSTRPGRVRALIDHEDKPDNDCTLDGGFENGVSELRDEDGGSSPEIRDSDMGGGNLVARADKRDELELVKEKQSTILDPQYSERCSGSMSSPKGVEGGENKGNSAKLVTISDVVVEVEVLEDCNSLDKVAVAEGEEEPVEHFQIKKDTQVVHCNVIAGGIPRSRIKEGRRCGLCGGGTDGKPPKRLANDHAGSDHEVCSGSSASEEFNYDEWDGFGDEPGWLGRLLGPINDRYGIAGTWVHQHCAVWSPEVRFIKYLLNLSNEIFLVCEVLNVYMSVSTLVAPSSL